jgi:hypothetical protein
MATIKHISSKNADYGAEISRIFFRIQSTFPKAGNKKAANLFRLTAHVPLWDGVIQL